MQRLHQIPRGPRGNRPPHLVKGQNTITTSLSPTTPLPRPTVKRAQAVVMHAAPLRYKPGTMRRWMEEDNRGVKIMGIRLTREQKPGKVASSLVIYMKSAVEMGKIHMGRKLFYTTRCDSEGQVGRLRIQGEQVFLLLPTSKMYGEYCHFGEYLVMYVDTGREQPGGGIVSPHSRGETCSLVICHASIRVLIYKKKGIKSLPFILSSHMHTMGHLGLL